MTWNVTFWPELRPTVIRSPGFSCLTSKKTAGPLKESTCPAITAGPTWPGTGLPVYQPASVRFVGGWSAPEPSRPSVCSVVCTLITGMSIDTGRASAVGELLALASSPVGDAIGTTTGAGGFAAGVEVVAPRAMAAVTPTTAATPSAAAATRPSEGRPSFMNHWCGLACFGCHFIARSFASPEPPSGGEGHDAEPCCGEDYPQRGDRLCAAANRPRLFGRAAETRAHPALRHRAHPARVVDHEHARDVLRSVQDHDAVRAVRGQVGGHRLRRGGLGRHDQRAHSRRD